MSVGSAIVSSSLKAPFRPRHVRLRGSASKTSEYRSAEGFGIVRGYDSGVHICSTTAMVFTSNSDMPLATARYWERGAWWWYWWGGTWYIGLGGTLA